MGCDIRRADFPPLTAAGGMAAQADQWFLEQIEANELTLYEALAIVSHMLQTITTLAGREERRHKRKRIVGD